MSRKNLVFLFSLIFIILLSSCGSGSDIPYSSSDLIDELYSEDNIIGNENETVAEQYSVGDVIFADGSVEKAESITAIDKNNLPIAVIAGFKDSDTAFGIGVHISSEPLQWALDDTIGYMTSFSNTICTQNNDMIFSGDTDGSDNWRELCIIDSEGADTAEINYPAFYFVNTYAESRDLSDICASDWYMPSISELCAIYENKEAINISLEKIYELDNGAAMNGLASNWYWSSSQASVEDDYAWFVHFVNGYAGECPKNFDNLHVLAVHDF